MRKKGESRVQRPLEVIFGLASLASSCAMGYFLFTNGLVWYRDNPLPVLASFLLFVLGLYFGITLIRPRSTAM